MIGTKGFGVMLVDDGSYDEFARRLRASENGYLLEEKIVQGEELARFHPVSVNTVRFVSLIDQYGRRKNVFALLRTGCGESFVDNVGSGGLASLIDLETGTVCSDALRGDTRYAVYPDSGCRFMGAVIPDWEDLVRIVDEVHQRCREQKVIGFDLAWTEKGWDIVEINPAPSFSTFQALTGRGIRDELTAAGIL